MNRRGFLTAVAAAPAAPLLPALPAVPKTFVFRRVLPWGPLTATLDGCGDDVSGQIAENMRLTQELVAAAVIKAG